MSYIKETTRLAPIRKIDAIDIENLRFLTRNTLDKLVFNHICSKIDWFRALDEIKTIGMPVMRGGVGRGAMRAMFYLAINMEASRVLEIGSKTGSSALAFSLALKYKSKRPLKFVTVDILDCNDRRRCQKRKHPSTPRTILKQAGCDSFVNFVIADSRKYLPPLKEKFDIIFIDGSHKSSDVYKDIMNSLNLLEKGGLILLHDYYKDLKPLWKERSQITYGVFVAVERVLVENPKIGVFELNTLPWVNHKGSCKAALAMLARKA